MAQHSEAVHNCIWPRAACWNAQLFSLHLKGSTKQEKADLTKHLLARDAACLYQLMSILQNTVSLALVSYFLFWTAGKVPVCEAGRLGWVSTGLSGCERWQREWTSLWKCPCPRQALWRCQWCWIRCPFLLSSGARNKRISNSHFADRQFYSCTLCVCVSFSKYYFNWGEKSFKHMGSSSKP